MESSANEQQESGTGNSNDKECAEQSGKKATEKLKEILFTDRSQKKARRTEDTDSEGAEEPSATESARDIFLEALDKLKRIQSHGNQHDRDLENLRAEKETEMVRYKSEMCRELQAEVHTHEKETQERELTGRLRVTCMKCVCLVGIVVLLAIQFGGCGVAARTFDADNMIYNYEHFHDLDTAFKAKVLDLATHTEIIKGEDDKRELRKLRMELVAIKSSCRSLVGTYNADSAKANRSLFKSNDLPDRLDMGACG